MRAQAADPVRARKFLLRTAMLEGLAAAAAIPILLHFFNRSRPRVIAWGSCAVGLQRTGDAPQETVRSHSPSIWRPRWLMAKWVWWVIAGVAC